MSGPIDHSNHYVIQKIEATQVLAVSFSPPFTPVTISLNTIDGIPIGFRSIYFNTADYRWKTDPNEEPGSVLCNLMVPISV